MRHMNKEELEIVDVLDKKDRLQKPSQEQVDRYKQVARYTKEMQTKKQTTIRFNVADLAALKAKAKEMGIGYQTLIQVLVHHYVKGKIKLEI